MPYTLLDETAATPISAPLAGAPLTSVGQTLSTLQADLLEELGNRGDANDPVKLAKWINKGYEYVCSILSLKSSFTDVSFSLVAGQALYLLPTTVAWIRGVSLVDTVNYPDSEGIKLTAIDIDTYRKLPEDDTSTSLPSSYLREGRILAIYPTPQSAVTAVLDFKVRPAPLVYPTDSPILPPEFHDSILVRAKYVAFRALKSYTEAGIARNDFVADIRPLEDNDAREQGETPSGMRPVRSAAELNNLRRTRGLR